MELIKISSWNTKFIVFGVMVILIVGSSTQSYAVEYHFEDDFSDPEMDDWTLTATDWTSGGSRDDVTETNHTWFYDNGELVSGGTEDTYNLNAAFVQDHTSIGGWSFDVYVPESAKPHSLIDWRIWGLLWSEFQMGGPSIENSTHWSDFGVSFTQNRIRFTGFNGTANDNYGRSYSFPMFEADKDQHYDIIRTEERFYVFIDDEIAMNISIPSTLGPDINFFTIAVVQGSNVKFDNIKITTDAVGLLDEKPDPPETASTTNNNLLFFGIGAGVIALTSGAFSWRQFKKKRIAKLVKISSNGQYPKVSQTISNIFDNNKSVYYLMLGYKTPRLDTLEKNLEGALSSEMQQYRHLLHPLRLSIMQLLYTSTKMTSLEVKERLDLSWSDYYNSINALQKAKIISVFEDFDTEGTKRQFLIMEEGGKDQYEELIKLVDRFVKMAKEFMPSGEDEYLYPHS